MKQIYIIIGLFLFLFIAGCNDNKVTGDVVVDLKENVIKNGETTTIQIDGKNTGNIPADVILRVIPEDETKLIISYPGSLEYTLQPSENTGIKIVNVQGFTDHTSTKYWIKIQFVNKATEEVLEEETEEITVEK